MGCFFGCAISVNWLAGKYRSNIHALTKAIDELNMMVRIEERSKKHYLKKAAEDCEKASQCYDKDYKSIYLKEKELNEKLASNHENAQLMIKQKVVSLESQKEQEIQALQDEFTTKMTRHFCLF